MNRAAPPEEIHRPLDEDPPAGLIPARIERELEPRGQPPQRFGGRGTCVEQLLDGDDLAFDLSERALEVGQPPLPECPARRVLAIPGGKESLGVGEAGRPHSERPHPRRIGTAAAAYADPELR